ncbi:MAG TPA: hypothetical protein PLO69_14040 [Gammaproteobacteria bacterium]|nr:hypothetical protein [Gammaproteobacteria bacterium]
MPCDPPWLQPLQRTQRTLAMGVHKLDPAEVLARETWRLAAAYLTQRWFPRSADLAIGELIHRGYLHAVWWYPILQQRCYGTYRPSWYRGTLLTWFRRSASQATGQWWYAMQRIDGAADPEAAIRHARGLPGAGNAAWIGDSVAFLAGLAATGGLKSVIAEYIVDLLAFRDRDEAFQKAFDYRALPHQRRVLRAAKRGTVSYLRHGRIIHLLADAHRVARDDSGRCWTDLREASVPVLDYCIRASRADKDTTWRVGAALQEEVLTMARAAIKAIVTSSRPAPARLQELRRFLYAFEATHRYATGARQQFIELSRYAASQSKRRLKAQLGQGIDKTLPRLRVTNALIMPKPNPFLEPQQRDDWERIFLPRRS